MKEHYCSDKCRENMKPCDLCLAQRSHQEDQRNLAEAKPTLKYNPFAKLLSGRKSL